MHAESGELIVRTCVILQRFNNTNLIREEKNRDWRRFGLSFVCKINCNDHFCPFFYFTYNKTQSSKMTKKKNESTQSEFKFKIRNQIAFSPCARSHFILGW